MSSCTEICVPHETVNDDSVTIVQWHAEHGGPVVRGKVLVSIETSKSVLEVEADTDGYLEIVKPAGCEVAVSDVIGRIHAEQGASQASLAQIDGYGGTAMSPATTNSPAGPAGTTISKKAQALIEQHGLDPDVFAGRGLVREADVAAYVAAKTQTANGTEPKAIRPAPSSATKKHGLFHDLSVSSSERGRSVIWLAWNYLFYNWLLGNLVRWAPRGVILPLHRLRGVKIGSQCFIDPTAIVETAYPDRVRIGNDVRIAAGAIMMTHIKAPHYLRETGLVPAVVKPVVLEDHCFIGVNAVIMPGVTIGTASVVASGAVVVNNVPSFTMVSGNPAKVIKRFVRPPEQT